MKVHFLGIVGVASLFGSLVISLLGSPVFAQAQLAQREAWLRMMPYQGRVALQNALKNSSVREQMISAFGEKNWNAIEARGSLRIGEVLEQSRNSKNEKIRAAGQSLISAITDQALLQAKEAWSQIPLDRALSGLDAHGRFLDERRPVRTGVEMSQFGREIDWATYFGPRSKRPAEYWVKDPSPIAMSFARANMRVAIPLAEAIFRTSQGGGGLERRMDVWRLIHEGVTSRGGRDYFLADLLKGEFRKSTDERVRNAARDFLVEAAFVDRYVDQINSKYPNTGNIDVQRARDEALGKTLEQATQNIRTLKSYVAITEVHPEGVNPPLPVLSKVYVGFPIQRVTRSREERSISLQRDEDAKKLADLVIAFYSYYFPELQISLLRDDPRIYLPSVSFLVRGDTKSDPVLMRMLTHLQYAADLAQPIRRGSEGFDIWMPNPDQKLDEMPSEKFMHYLWFTNERTGRSP